MAADGYRHLGEYSDLVSAARSRWAAPRARVSAGTIRELLAFGAAQEAPQDPVVERRWEGRGIRGEEVSWSVGYGPRTRAWLLRPAPPTTGRRPAVLALHDHGNFKWLGKEKIADDDHEPSETVRLLRERAYGGAAFANRLADRLAAVGLSGGGADAAIRRVYAGAGAPGNYRGQFYPGGHRFDLEMQDAAFGWLESALTVTDRPSGRGGA